MQSDLSIERLRREYTHGGLNREDLNDDPINQFQHWLQQAIDAGIQDPTAMIVATADASGQPSQRIVLLKQLDASGFVFFTNYQSHKAQELAINPKCSLHFPWHILDRQVKILGTAEKLDVQANQQYFQSRPRESQLAALASQQSQPIESRAALLARFNQLKHQYANQPVPLPENWGGYRVVPHQIEFWQGGEFRLHDRFVYTRQDDSKWHIERLMP